jgi:hypothetical protein
MSWSKSTCPPEKKPNKHIEDRNPANSIELGCPANSADYARISDLKYLKIDICQISGANPLRLSVFARN